MCTDYRECLRNSRMTGKAMDFSYKEHGKEAVLAELINKLETKNTANEDMLWFLKHSETLERGIYSWNQPPVDLVIVAPPALMALIMGEYELAVQLCRTQEKTLWSNTVEELYQENGCSQIGGGCYSFCEACLLSDGMGENEIRYFFENGYYDAKHLVSETDGMLSDIQFHANEEDITEDIWHPLQGIQSLRKSIGNTDELLRFAVPYVLKLEMDHLCEHFWKRLYEMFPAREEHFIIIEALHSYILHICSTNTLPVRFEERLLKGVHAYFAHEEQLPMGNAVETYILERITSKTYFTGKRRYILENYFDAVKKFDGTISPKWKSGMSILLSSYNTDWLNRGFQNGFLRKDCINDYIDLLLHEQDPKHSSYIPRLIQIKWQDTLLFRQTPTLG